MARNLLSILDLTRDELLMLTDPNFVPEAPQAEFKGALSFLFLQPSLRTMSSFANAGALLGLAPVPIRTTGDEFRDQVDLDDEIEQLAMNSRCVVARTATPLSADRFKNTAAPVINAGDGANEHPTQALIDLTTLRKLGVEGKHVVMMGNVRDYRVHHSLVRGLAALGLCSVELLCPKGMPLGDPYLPKDVNCTEVEADVDADEVLARADFVYLTPTQHFSYPHLQFGQRFSLAQQRAKRVLRAQAKILHPFPRLQELDRDLDATPFNAYHLQTSLATPTRKRLMAWLLSQ